MNGLASDAAARMDRIYRHQRHIYDLTRRPYLLGRAEMVRCLKPPVGGHVLEIACGTAWNLVRAAELHPGAHFYGLDISSAMLAVARSVIARRGLQGRIRVAEADATSFDPMALFGRAGFDRILISYALSMIPNWTCVLARASDAVTVGGSVHIVDFGTCKRLPDLFRRTLAAWLSHFSVTPRTGLPSAIEALACAKGLECEVAQLYRGYTIRAVLTKLH